MLRASRSWRATTKKNANDEYYDDDTDDDEDMLAGDGLMFADDGDGDSDGAQSTGAV